MRKHFYIPMFVLMAAALILSACASTAASTNNPGVPVSGNGSSGNNSLPAGSVQINGAGSTFQQPAMDQWTYDYSNVDPSVVINYQGTGSGAGKTALINGTIDYAGSDSVLKPDEATAGKDLQMLPILAGAEVMTYNLPELSAGKDAALILDGKTLVGLYNGTIKMWNDPAITALNPSIASKLPAKQITVVHRSDGSGTTEIFTNALASFSSDWTAGHGSSIEWPVDKAGNGIGGKGNQGVTAAVQNTPDSIGYVEFAYAVSNKLPFAQMVNQAGKTVTAGPDTVTAAMTEFANSFGPDLTAVIVNGKSDNAWPITGYTYVIIHMKNMTDCTKYQKLVSFINWFLTDSAAIKQATSLGFVPLPDAVKTQVQAKLGQVTCNGQPLK